MITISHAENGYIINTNDPDSLPVVVELKQCLNQSEFDLSELQAIRDTLWTVYNALGPKTVWGKDGEKLRISIQITDGHTLYE